MIYIIIMKPKSNIAIVGSGLTGSIASLALAHAGYKIALIDPKSFKGFLKKTMTLGQLPYQKI